MPLGLKAFKEGGNMEESEIEKLSRKTGRFVYSWEPFWLDKIQAFRMFGGLEIVFGMYFSGG